MFWDTDACVAHGEADGGRAWRDVDGVRRDIDGAKLGEFDRVVDEITEDFGKACGVTVEGARNDWVDEAVEFEVFGFGLVEIHA